MSRPETLALLNKACGGTAMKKLQESERRKRVCEGRVGVHGDTRSVPIAAHINNEDIQRDRSVVRAHRR